jgi:PAS domain S-box-containing protein
MKNMSGNFHRSPLKLLVILVVAIYLVEGMIMYLLNYYFPSVPLWMEILIDPLILVLFLFPVIYLSMFKPLLNNVLAITRVRQTMLEKEERFEAVVETASDSIISIDSSGKIVFWNRAAEETFGYTSEEMIGQDVIRIMPEKFHQAHKEGMKRLAETDEPKFIGGDPVEVIARGKDGIEIPVELSLAKWSTSKGTYYTSIIRDITERKSLERMKDDFISTVTHELRTPLTSIHGSLDMIARGMAGELSEKVRKMLEIAVRNSGRLKKLINDILDVQRFESNRMDFRMEPLKLASVVMSSLENNKSFSEQFNVEFVMELDLPDIEVNADSDRLSQVMDNLLSNAAKFSPPESEVNVSVSYRNGMARVDVKDSGPGIPEDFRASVFGKFAQAGGSNDEKRRGSGLGLSIAKLIIEKHGGKIGFDTETGKGTTFYFELPKYGGKTDR